VRLGLENRVGVSADVFPAPMRLRKTPPGRSIAAALNNPQIVYPQITQITQIILHKEKQGRQRSEATCPRGMAGFFTTKGTKEIPKDFVIARSFACFRDSETRGDEAIHFLQTSTFCRCFASFFSGLLDPDVRRDDGISFNTFLICDSEVRRSKNLCNLCNLWIKKFSRSTRRASQCSCSEIRQFHFILHLLSFIFFFSKFPCFSFFPLPVARGAGFSRSITARSKRRCSCPSAPAAR
jgi:hypothetical protein